MFKTFLILMAFAMLTLLAKPTHGQPKADPESKEYVVGKEKAALAIRRRKLTFISSGLVEITDGTYEGEDSIFRKMMWKRYRVAIDNFGCTTSSKQLSYEAGYNHEIMRYLRERYGEDVVSKTSSEAKQIYEKRRERALARTKKKRFGSYKSYFSKTVNELLEPNTG